MIKALFFYKFSFCYWLTIPKYRHVAATDMHYLKTIPMTVALKEKYYLTLIFAIASFLTFAQCEGLKVDKEVRKN